MECSKVTATKFTTAKFQQKLFVPDFPTISHPYFIPNTKRDPRSIPELKVKCVASKTLEANINHLLDLW